MKGAEYSLRYYRGDDAEESHEIRLELQSLAKSVEAESSTSKKFSLKDLRGKHSRKVLTYGFMLVALQQFCGGFPMLNFTATIFQESGSNLSPNTSSIIVGVVQILGAVLCTFLVERAGRKMLFLTSALGVCAGLGVMSLYTYQTTHGVDLASLNWIPLVSFSFVMFIYNLGVNTLPFMYVSEIVELKNKRFTMTFCLTILYIFSTIVIQVRKLKGRFYQQYNYDL